MKGEYEISVEISPEDDKKIKEIIEEGKYQDTEDFIGEAVRKLLRKELSKRTIKDVKIFSDIKEGTRVQIEEKKQQVIGIQNIKIQELVEFQLFETNHFFVVIVDREGYDNSSLAFEISQEDYFWQKIDETVIRIKGENYLVFYYDKDFLYELPDKEAKEVLLKAALEFRMKTIDGFLIPSLFLFSSLLKICFLGHRHLTTARQAPMFSIGEG